MLIDTFDVIPSTNLNYYIIFYFMYSKGINNKHTNM